MTHSHQAQPGPPMSRLAPVVGVQWVPPSPRASPCSRPQSSEQPRGCKRVGAKIEARLSFAAPPATCPPCAAGWRWRLARPPRRPDARPALLSQGHGAAAAAAAVRGRPPLVRPLRQPRRQWRHGGWQEKASKVAAVGDVGEEVSGLPAPVLPVHGEPGSLHPHPVPPSPLPCTSARPSPRLPPGGLGPVCPSVLRSRVCLVRTSISPQWSSPVCSLLVSGGSCCFWGHPTCFVPVGSPPASPACPALGAAALMLPCLPAGVGLGHPGCCGPGLPSGRPLGLRAPLPGSPGLR